MNALNLLLKGRVGSHAFGLAHQDSDEDFQGIFVAPTHEFLGLSSGPQESYSFRNPDTTYHEVGKYCRLALKCNPTALDLMWLDEYNLRTQLGTELINLRNNFLSAPYVRNSYLGYATTQFTKLSKDPRSAKRAKNARHFYRLLEQGFQLYSEGTYSVRLENPEKFKAFGEAVANDPQVANSLLVEYANKFDSTQTVLPKNPNSELIEEWLQKVRHEFYRFDYSRASEAVEELKKWPR